MRSSTSQKQKPSPCPHNSPGGVLTSHNPQISTRPHLKPFQTHPTRLMFVFLVDECPFIINYRTCIILYLTASWEPERCQVFFICERQPIHMTTPTIPIAPGWPLIGHAMAMAKDPLVLFNKLYKTFGPIFEVRAFHHRFVVMAGQDANLFLVKEGDKHFLNEPVFGEFHNALESDALIVAVDGAKHKHLRKLLKNGYSKFALAPHFETIVRQTRETFAKFSEGQVFDAVETNRVMVTDQLGMILNNEVIGETLSDLQTFFKTVLNVGLLKSQPRWTLPFTSYPKAREKVLALAQRVLENHKGPKEGRSRDVIDDLLDAEDEHGKPLEDHAIRAAVIGGYLAGMDTITTTLSFFMYAVLHHKEVQELMRAEADALFAKESPTLDDIKEMKVTYGALFETMRMYPLGAGVLRHVYEPFSFKGYDIKVGDQVMLSLSTTHFQEAFFPRPYQFEYERFLKPRLEHRQNKSVYAPFALGTRTCLGAGMAEVHCMLAMATFLHFGEFALAPEDYKLDVWLNPVRVPKGLKIKYIKRRH